MLQAALLFWLITTGNTPRATGGIGQELAGRTVAVTTDTGRTHRGEVDPRSDDQTLWLTATTAGVTITSQVRIDRVATIEDAEPVAPAPLWTRPAAVAAATVHQAPAPAEPVEAFARAQSLEVLAKVTNWDADPQADGVRLIVQPRSRDGYVTPVAGSVRVELLVATGGRPSQREFRVKERWQQKIDPSSFTAEGAELELPFRTVNPEGVSAEFPMAILRVRLLVPGQGALDALVTDLPLRRYSFNRDRQQQWTGQRSLPGEAR